MCRGKYLVIAFSFLVLAFLVPACSNANRPETKTYSMGEKVSSGPFIYSVLDTQVLARLGSDANPRNPSNRFYLVQLSVSNSGNAKESVPSLALVDDQGQSYPELSDGQSVPDWFGLFRDLGPGETRRANIAFDVPAKHYRLKVSDEFDEAPVYVDLPLNYIHENLGNTLPPLSKAQPVSR
jgi:uncharacterized protein DUF4352